VPNCTFIANNEAGRIEEKKVVTYFKTSFTFPEDNENIREVDQVDTNSPKTRPEKGNKQEERERKKKKKKKTSKFLMFVYVG